MGENREDRISPASKDSSRQAVPRFLLDRHEAAAVLGVSSRTFEELMDEPWMPRPVRLGPRLLRWAVSELQEAIASMPRQLQKQEPVRQKIERLKAGL